MKELKGKVNVNKWYLEEVNNNIYIFYNNEKDEKILLARRKYSNSEYLKINNIIKNEIIKAPYFYNFIIKIYEEQKCFNNDVLKYKIYKLINKINDFDEKLNVFFPKNRQETAKIMMDIKDEELAFIKLDIDDQNLIDVVCSDGYIISIEINEENFQDIYFACKLIYNLKNMMDIFKECLLNADLSEESQFINELRENIFI